MSTKASTTRIPSAIYPFGMVMPGREYTSEDYKFGFNGKEKEQEMDKVHYDFGARKYDGRIGRWLSIDPLFSRFVGITPYRAFLNNPIQFVDVKGETEIRKYKKDGTYEADFVADGSLCIYTIDNFSLFGSKFDRRLKYMAAMSSNYTECGVDVSIEAYKEYEKTANPMWPIESFDNWKSNQIWAAQFSNTETLINEQTDYAVSNWLPDKNGTYCNYNFWNALFSVTQISPKSWNSKYGSTGYMANNIYSNISSYKWNYSYCGNTKEETLFLEVDWTIAVLYAKSGNFVVAVKDAKAHGHVTVLSTDQEGVTSKDDIQTNNVGSKNGLKMKLNTVWTNKESREKVKFYILNTKAESQDGKTTNSPCIDSSNE